MTEMDKIKQLIIIKAYKKLAIKRCI